MFNDATYDFGLGKDGTERYIFEYANDGNLVVPRTVLSGDVDL